MKRAHAVRFGIDYLNQQLNHFQPQGGTFQTVRGTFQFNGNSMFTVMKTILCLTARPCGYTLHWTRLACPIGLSRFTAANTEDSAGKTS